MWKFLFSNCSTSIFLSCQRTHPNYLTSPSSTHSSHSNVLSLSLFTSTHPSSSAANWSSFNLTTTTSFFMPIQVYLVSTGPHSTLPQPLHFLCLSKFVWCQLVLIQLCHWHLIFACFFYPSSSGVNWFSTSTSFHSTLPLAPHF